jgi:hypothetical protein
VAPGLRETRGVDVELGPRGEQREALGERLHHSVLDPVVDHLRVMARAARPAVQPAAVLVGGEDAREGLEDLDRARRAAEHQAVAVLESVNAARDAGIDVAQALLRQRHRAAHRVAVVAVAGLDDGVARGAERQQILYRVLHCVASRQHDDDDALAREARAQRGEVLGTVDAGFTGQRLARLLRAVVADDMRAAARQPPRHARAHPAQSDDSYFHVCSSLTRRILGSECESTSRKLRSQVSWRLAS